MKRYLFQQVKADLSKKMVFIGGPRQVGKTYLAEAIADDFSGTSAYLNWDNDDDREKILRREFPQCDLLIFDEIHKNRKWRGLIKGLYDKQKKHVKFLVTGSARLDYYRFSGDSLQGRYFYYRLHPLSVAELSIVNQDELKNLLKLGGFPEPFFSGSEIEAQRWSKLYRQRLIREDWASLESTIDLARVELLAMRLPELVGSPLSTNSLREQLNISHATASKWLDIMERLYHIFRLHPFGSPRIKAVKKEAKHYLYDWSLVQDEGYRFENMIACHLLKWCHFREDVRGENLELRYFRDTEKREVDFVVVKGDKPELFCEVKSGVKAVSPDLHYLKKKFPHVRAVQVSLEDRESQRTENGIELLSALTFLKEFI